MSRWVGAEQVTQEVLRALARGVKKGLLPWIESAAFPQCTAAFAPDARATSSGHAGGHALRDRCPVISVVARQAGAATAGLQKVMGARRPAVFLDYNGVLTPIVDHPEDARISAAMGDVVRGLARRTTVCVVSGRDRPADYALASVGEVERFLDRLAP